MIRAQLLFSPPNGTKAEYYAEKANAEYKFRFYPFDKAETPISIEMEKIEAPLEYFYQNELALDSISKRDYLKKLEQVIEKIKVESWQKVVLSRSKYFDVDLNPIKYFNTLRMAYPEAAVYCFTHPNSGTWIGASPELLLQVNEQNAQTMSLAGTARKGEGNELGIKEEKEQKYVTEYILKTLSGFQEVKDLNISSTENVIAAKLLHIRNIVTFSLSDNFSLEKILNALHPTPAVAALPMKEGINFIKEVESASRSFYSGYFGLSKEQKSVFYVNLRCLQYGSNGIKLYAGGGITNLSDPLKEWEETNAKMETLARLIDVNLLND